MHASVIQGILYPKHKTKVISRGGMGAGGQIHTYIHTGVYTYEYVFTKRWRETCIHTHAINFIYTIFHTVLK